jgi:hypothetical protein
MRRIDHRPYGFTLCERGEKKKRITFAGERGIDRLKSIFRKPDGSRPRGGTTPVTRI